MTERRFPIMGRGIAARATYIPWRALEPHEAQARSNHSQTLARLAERGGLDPAEALAVIEDRAWRPMDYDEAMQQLLKRVENA